MVWLVFVLGTIICWGLYGPVIHMGQVALGSPLRALLCVGFAYFLMAVLIPGGAMMAQAEEGAFTTKGIALATLAGVLGALGAIGVIYAFRHGGSPLIAMPLIFGGAPIVNVLFSMIQHPPKSAPHPLLYVGFVLAAGGAFLILRFKPA